MISFLKEWIVNIVTLAIFIVLLEILIPSGKTKKYINLVSGLILIIALINPVLKFIGKDIDIKEFEISNSNFLNKKEIEANSSILEDKRMKLTADIYRQNIIKQIESIAKKIKGVSNVRADVIINEDYKSSSFGEIKRVYLYLDMEGDNKTAEPVVRIEKIEISDGDEKDNTLQETQQEIDPETRSQIEEKIYKTLQVEKENIVFAASSK